jgi:ribose transport system permease protein
MVDSTAATVKRPLRSRVTAHNVNTFLERSGLPIFLLVIIIFFSVISTGASFRTAANLQNIFANQSVTGLIALGSVLPMVAGYIDLSVAAIAGISSVTFAAVTGTHGDSVLVGIIAALVMGVLAGAVNAVLVAVVRLNAFICTLGTYTLFGGLLQLYTKGQTVGNTGLPVSLSHFFQGKWLGIARPFWLLMIVAVAAWYLLTQTPFGRKLTAIGSNETAARLAGFRVDRMVFITFLLSGLLGAFAGILLTAQNLGADSTTAPSYLFAALAAVFLGQTAIRPGQYNVWGTMFGVFLVAVAVDGFTLLGAQAWVTPVFDGGALLLSVAFSTLMARARDRRATAAALHAAEEAPASPPGLSRSASGGVSTA